MSLYLQSYIAASKRDCKSVFKKWIGFDRHPGTMSITKANELYFQDDVPEEYREEVRSRFSKVKTEISFKHSRLPASEVAYLAEVSQVISDRLDTWAIVTDDSSDVLYHIFCEGFCLHSVAPESLGQLLWVPNTSPQYLSEQMNALTNKRERRHRWKATQQNASDGRPSGATEL